MAIDITREVLSKYLEFYDDENAWNVVVTRSKIVPFVPFRRLRKVCEMFQRSLVRVEGIL